MWLFSSRFTLALLNGVPTAQQKLLRESAGYDTVIAFIKESFETILTTLPMKDNYFYRVYLEDGRYTKECCPDYLIEENFNALKGGLVDRISIHTDFIEDFLHTQVEEENGHKKPIKDIDRYILLDHMDWMSTNPKLLESEWKTLLEHAKDDCRFLWRSASKDSEFVLNTAVQWNGRKSTVGQILDLNKPLARKLHAKDRVHTYTSFVIGDLL